MMRKILAVMMASLMLVSCFSLIAFAENTVAYNTSITPLRAGGGGGGSGSSGSGGGSSGSGSGLHHPGTGQSATLWETVFLIVVLPLVALAFPVVFYTKLTKRSRKAKKMMKQLMKSDRAWKYKDIASAVKNSFMAIQTAWTNMDLSPASGYMSDDLYDRFQTKLNWMAYRNERNVLENIQLVQALPVAAYDDEDNSRDYIWFYIKGRMVDYTIDTDSGRKISGTPFPTSFVEYWQFTRKENQWVLNEILQKNESSQIPFTE